MTPPAATATRPQVDTLPHEPTSHVETPKIAELDAPLGKVAGYEEIIKHYYGQIPAQHAREYEHAYLRAGFPKASWPPLEEIPIPDDRALFADPEYKELFAAATEVEHITPKFGTILHGVNLAKLNDNQKDELARLVAFRGVVFFRDQEDAGVNELLELGRHYGPLHRNGSTPVPHTSNENEELFNVHVVDASERKNVRTGHVTQFDLWHSDVTYEIQPSGYAFLKIFQGPPVGGDTSWTSSYATYDEISRPLAEYLEKLTASHSSQWQIEAVERAGFSSRRPTVVTSHPIIRTNPVTGWKSVFVNPVFTTKIDGVSKQESDTILNYIYNTFAANVAETVRWKWRKNDIAMWDNRSTNHAASYGTYPHYRHGIRITAQAEKPVLNGGVSQADYFAEKLKNLSIN